MTTPARTAVLRHARDTGTRLPRWEDHAACTTADPDLFWPASTGPAPAGRTARAKAVCARCPVRTDCLEDALASSRTYGRYGIRGGLTEQERARLKRRRRTRAA